MNLFLDRECSPGRRAVILSACMLPTLFLVACKTEPAPPQSNSPSTPAVQTVPAATVAPAARVEAAPAPSKPDTAREGEWEDLFDGRTLAGWRVTDFAGKGEVRVDNGRIILGMGVMTGVTRTNPVPKMNYEVSLEAMRVEGSDFFCGLTFPVNDDPCTLIVGGWGGGLVGLSSLDGMDAANNETSKFMSFENGRWYRIRLCVKPTRIQAWIDNEQVVDVDTKDRKISIRWEVEESRPLGIATWSTSAALRQIRVREL
jgi:hypothetical protein